MKYVSIWLLIQVSTVYSPIPERGVMLAFESKDICENDAQRYTLGITNAGHPLLKFECFEVAMILNKETYHAR